MYASCSSSRISILSAVTEISAVHLLEDDPFVHDPQLANVRSVVYRPNEILAPSYLPLVSDCVLLYVMWCGKPYVCVYT